MAGSANTTVKRSGMAAMKSSRMTRRGPGNRSTQNTRRSRPNPAPMLKGMPGLKGMDKGSG